MGFFSWLFGRKKQEEELPELDHEPMRMDSPIVEVKPNRAKYKNVPRTSETNEYIKSLLKKAQNPDLKPHSYKDTSNLKQAKDFVEKVQGRHPEENQKNKKTL